MHLSLASGTKIGHLHSGTGITKATAVEEMAGKDVMSYDWWGRPHWFQVAKEPVTEKRIVMSCTSGEPLSVGDTHHQLCRLSMKARYTRIPIADHHGPMFVRMPQRKVWRDQILFDALEMDDDDGTMILKPETARDFLPLMEAAAFAGLTVKRAKDKLRIDIEYKRPSCFASKLIMGNFDTDLENALEELAAKAILQPTHPFNETVTLAMETGIIFEGGSLFNEVIAIPMHKTDQSVEVFHVTPIDPHKINPVPLDLTWFAS